jgi:cytochrome c oxidase assembly protein subunit 15
MAEQRKVENALRLLLIMIVGLMALGAGVRAMDAGLSCPDWPLCFGKIVPDFHPAVWFEFVHRAYAGLVALLFFWVCYRILIHKNADSYSLEAKRAAVVGLVFLSLQILMGGLTVLLLVKWIIVTSHLMLATLFFCSVLWMLFAIRPRVETSGLVPSAFFSRQLRNVTACFVLATFVQIFVGGAVASTYAGSICVDWPLCGGQWVPTWTGAIGLQIIHRFIAYGLALALFVFAVVLHIMKLRSSSKWLSEQVLSLSRWSAILVLAQVVVGVANLVLSMPPAVTVFHQSVAIALFAINLRFFLVARALSNGVVAVSHPTSVASAQALGGVSG